MCTCALGPRDTRFLLLTFHVTTNLRLGQRGEGTQEEQDRGREMRKAGFSFLVPIFTAGSQALPEAGDQRRGWGRRASHPGPAGHLHHPGGAWDCQWHDGEGGGLPGDGLAGEAVGKHFVSSRACCIKKAYILVPRLKALK